MELEPPLEEHVAHLLPCRNPDMVRVSPQHPRGGKCLETTVARKNMSASALLSGPHHHGIYKQEGFLLPGGRLNLNTCANSK